MLLNNADAVSEEYGCVSPHFGTNLAISLIMEAITNNENGPVLRAYSKSDSAPRKGSASASDSATNAKLTDVSKIADQARKTGEEIRPDAIERGKALLADPNWPNDATIEGLAEKLLSTDDFVS